MEVAQNPEFCVTDGPFEAYLANVIPFPAQKYAKIPLEERFQRQQWSKQSCALSEGGGSSLPPIPNREEQGKCEGISVRPHCRGGFDRHHVRKDFSLGKEILRGVWRFSFPRGP